MNMGINQLLIRYNGLYIYIYQWLIAGYHIQDGYIYIYVYKGYLMNEDLPSR